MTKQEARRLDQYYRRTYGITFGQYRAMFKMQRGRCATCDTKPKKRRLHVDHDHKTGVVRGLLCFRCNKLLVGRHTAQTAKRVYEYLSRIFDGRKIEEAKAAPKIRSGGPEVYKVRKEFLPAEVTLGTEHVPTVRD